MNVRLLPVVALLAAGCGNQPTGLHLDQVLPASACPGARVDLQGGGFGDGTASFVTIGGAAIQPGPADATNGGVLSWGDRDIAVLVPNTRPGNVLVTVTVGGQVTTPRPLEVLSTCPVLDAGTSSDH
jgi:hypothetical protein